MMNTKRLAKVARQRLKGQQLKLVQQVKVKENTTTIMTRSINMAKTAVNMRMKKRCLLVKV